MKPLSLSRRSFLAGAGAAVGAAALGGLGTGMAQQMGASSPRRFVFVLRVNGFDSNILMAPQAKDWIGNAKGSAVRDDIWWGTQYNDNRGYGDHATTTVLPNSLAGAPGLASLESMGLLSRASVMFGLGSPITGGGHSASHGVLSSTRTLAGRPGGQSIDDFLSYLPSVRGMGERRTPLAAVRLGVGTNLDGVSYSMAAAAPGQALPALLSEEAAWNAYVRPLLDPNGMDDLQRRVRLLEVARKDLERASRLAPDSQQLRQYGASIASISMEQDIFAQRIADAMNRGLSDAPSLADVQAARLPGERVAVQMRNISTILEAGLTNVVLLGIGTGGFSFTFELGPHSEFNHAHALCHEFSLEGDDSRGIRQELRQAWRLELDAVASLAAHLDSVPESDGSGSMLDNTAIVYLPDNGVGHHAKADDHPLLVIGGENMGMRTGGSTVFFPGYKAGDERVQLSSLWNTFTHLASGGDEDVKFEAAYKISSNTIAEIMNV